MILGSENPWNLIPNTLLFFSFLFLFFFLLFFSSILFFFIIIPKTHKNIIISCNHLIKEFCILIKENPALYSWIFACMTLYKMTILYSADALFSAIMDDYILNPLKSHLQLLLEYIPRLASYISIDKSSLEINNVGGYILTKQSQIAAQNTLKTIVDNSDTNITTIGFIIGVGIFIACLKYFAE